MFNEMMELLSDVPPTLAAGWAVWIGAGALLVMWYRKAKANVEMHPAVASRAVTRAKSGRVRSPKRARWLNRAR